MKTTYDTVRDAIVILKEISDRDIQPESTYDELGLDSLDLVELVMYLEEDFDIVIPDQEFEACKDVGDIVKLIDKLNVE
jgi:acyl carrier protein